jgi:hypothetical protein
MTKYLEFEVSLDGIEPRLWRRFLLPQTGTFIHLHAAIQCACGWDDSHLFEFSSGQGRRTVSIAGIPAEETWEEPTPDARKVRLSSFFTRANKKCTYTYDFGDDWEHTVQLKRIIESDEQFKRRLVGGEGAFPPEDCGGIWGYVRCLVATGALSNDEAKISEDQLEDTRDWLGDWQPDPFDFDEIKRRFDC